MAINNDIKNVESRLKQKMYLSFHRDGLIDILMGWNLFAIGLFLQTHSVLFSYIGLLPLLLFKPLKDKITYPRLGYAKFRTKRTLSMRTVGGLGGLLVAGVIVTGFILKTTEGTIAIVIFGIAFMMFFVSGFNRIFGYALFIPLFIAGGLGLGFLSPGVLMAVGVTVLLMGVWMLVSFLRNYPIADVEKPDVTE